MKQREYQRTSNRDFVLGIFLLKRPDKDNREFNYVLCVLMRLVPTMKVGCVLCEVRNVAEETLKDPGTTIERDFFFNFLFYVTERFTINQFKSVNRIKR